LILVHLSSTLLSDKKPGSTFASDQKPSSPFFLIRHLVTSPSAFDQKPGSPKLSDQKPGSPGLGLVTFVSFVHVLYIRLRTFDIWVSQDSLSKKKKSDTWQASALPPQCGGEPCCTKGRIHVPYLSASHRTRACIAHSRVCKSSVGLEGAARSIAPSCVLFDFL
jgi:hypothetical protein